MFAFSCYLTGTNTFRLFGRRQYLRPQGARAHYNTMPNAEDRWHVTLTLFTNSFSLTCACAQTHKHPPTNYIILSSSSQHPHSTGAAFTAQVGNPVQWCTLKCASSKHPHHQVHWLFYNEPKYKHCAIFTSLLMWRKRDRKSLNNRRQN